MKKAKDLYGETVIVFEINENMVRTNKGLYHITKLIFNK